jgi:hypothetical protein
MIMMAKTGMPARYMAMAAADRREWVLSHFGSGVSESIFTDACDDNTNALEDLLGGDAEEFLLIRVDVCVDWSRRGSMDPDNRGSESRQRPSCGWGRAWDPGFGASW